MSALDRRNPWAAPRNVRLQTQILEFIDMEHTPKKYHDPCDPPGKESRWGGIRDNDEGIACEADIVWIVGGEE